MSTATITFGRNVDGEPMSATAWEGFHAAVLAVLNRLDATVLSDATYTGSWEGVTEDAAIVLCEVEPTNSLRDALAGLARIYAQDAIGLTVGEGELVTAPREAAA